MRRMIGIMVAALLMASPALAQQNAHGQAADRVQGMMQGHCGVTPGGMMQGMMGGAMSGAETMPGGMTAPGRMGGGMMEGMMGSGMMQGGMMDMAGGPGMILGLGETLNLSSDQVGTLEQMKESTDSQVRQHLITGREAQQAATGILRSGSTDLEAYEQKLREAADQFVLARMVMARADVQARQKLTPEQLEKLELSRETMMELCRNMEGTGGMTSGSNNGRPGQGG